MPSPQVSFRHLGSNGDALELSSAGSDSLQPGFEPIKPQSPFQPAANQARDSVDAADLPVSLSQAFPAFSAPVNPTGSRNAPAEGESQLLDIEKEAQKAVLEKPYSLEETQSKANAGLNELQGTADADKMKRPENAQGSSVEDKLKNVLEKVTGRD